MLKLHVFDIKAYARATTQPEGLRPLRTCLGGAGALFYRPARQGGIVCASALARTEAINAIRATRLSAALAAWEYSHCARSAIQSSGSTVQLLVAWLVGNVKVQNTTCVAKIQAKPTRASMNSLRRLRTMTVRMSVDSSAPATTNPSKAHPL
ncbi:hypothetical protein ebA6413 [Aromatoleum aromaticum EbN1]|uniref:Uncharacterized protein n=1 Tax=Aromatoleum aromaticum (strain DSM 19018 / LMG 30748 / EbN1) TaxID=76114 RepID=Q5NYS0_AROAE|nr:hypothetical protein ebA6413 [Aromatoleum aromaticum EbN1]